MQTGCPRASHLAIRLLQRSIMCSNRPATPQAAAGAEPCCETGCQATGTACADCAHHTDLKTTSLASSQAAD